MADLTASSFVSIDTIMSNLDQYKHNPSAIQRVVLNMLDEITAGTVNVVDPTSPFVFLLEASAVNTAMAVNETNTILTKQYPSLSQTEDDLYHHMSDVDYLNRFASPSTGIFTIAVQANDVMNKMVWDASENAYKATLPRDTVITVDGYAFTFLFPIDIRKYVNGVIQISYDNAVTSPLADLQSNIIVPTVRVDNSQVNWLFFDVPLKQIAIDSSNYPVQAGAVFKQDIQYADQFYYIRAYYRNDASSNEWVEFKTTHSDQVYDPLVPTARIQVYSGYVTVDIPMIYLTTELISGEVRFDVYSSKGNLSVNLSNYKPSAFSTELRAIDETRDLNVYTAAMGNISYYSYSADFVSGGANAIDYLTLRDRVISNSTGVIKEPITNKQIQAYTENSGFTIVKNADTITNRLFLATQKLPKPQNTKLATSSNIGISSFITNMAYLSTLDTVISNVNRSTILSKNLYINENGIIRILKSSEVSALKAMSKSNLVTEINSKDYIYSPFYYVLDDSDNEFQIRAYDLDYPTAANLSFISQNQTLQLPVNTSAYTFVKTETGYKLTVVTASGNFYKQMEDSAVSVQLGYYPIGETKMAYINGVLSTKDENNNRVWTFDLVTNYDLNSSDQLCITNGRMFNSDTVNTWIDLTQTFHLFYATISITQSFVADASDALLGKFLLPTGSVGDTHETIDLTEGKALTALWRRSRSIAAGQVYQTYEFDEPLYYDKDIYETDPVTGSIIHLDTNGEVVYVKLHSYGDPVLDVHGNQVYKHRKGDVVLDANGNPVISTSLSVDKELDMMFVDGRQYFVDDPAFVAYNAEMVKVLDTWIVEDMAAIQDVLLEQSKIYFYPKTTLGSVKVFTKDQGQDTLPAEQSLVVDLYVKSDVYNNSDVRTQLRDNTVEQLDTYISGSVVNTSQITKALSDMYGTSVQSSNLSGLGGSKNYKILTLADEQYRLCLKKVLALQLDNSLIIQEDVTVNFYLVP